MLPQNICPASGCPRVDLSFFRAESHASQKPQVSSAGHEDVQAQDGREDPGKLQLTVLPIEQICRTEGERPERVQGT